MNFYNIFCFITLSQQLNFTKSSSLLHITQPTLSKIISSLEDEIGCDLFIRTKHSVKLTPAGATFYNYCVKLNTTFNDALIDVKSIGSGKKGVVKIGFFNEPIGHMLPDIIDVCNEKCPDVEIELFENRQVYLINQLISGDIDIALLCDWELDNIPNYSKHIIYRDKYCIAINKSHPLACESSINIHDLKDELFITCKHPDEYGIISSYKFPSSYKTTNTVCINGGFIPSINTSATSFYGLLAMVACNKGVGIVASHLSQHTSHDNVAFIPIRDVDMEFQGIMVYPDKTKNHSIREVSDAIKTIELKPFM